MGQGVVSAVPALLLAPLPEHICLDLCAAPGSKSVQLIESMRCLEQSRSMNVLNCFDQMPGAVISADKDAERACKVLNRVLGKIASPASGAVLANAKFFPHLLDMTTDGARINFDRILADVPCSGDGTVRKNSQIWHAWSRNVSASIRLHSLQRNILRHALYLAPP